MRKLVALTMLAALALPTGAGAALLPQDDAGSGVDAPGTPTPSFRIDPGVLYTGTIEGKTGGDSADWYAFTAPAGATLEARVTNAAGCVYLHDAAGEQLGGDGCALGFAEVTVARAVAAAAGTYYVQYTYRQPHLDDSPPQAYRFGVGVNAPAPVPGAPFVADDDVPERPDLQDLLALPEYSVAPVTPASQNGDHVVVAVVDSGVNLYHDFFAAPALTDHPSTWLPAFPATAESVDLSLDEPVHADAVAADAETFASLERSTYDPGSDTFDTHLYTFPGTRVVGAVSFGEYAGQTDAAIPRAQTPVLDDFGHGTHSAGLALGARLAEADGNVLLVMVEIGQGSFETGIRWAARQPWIDAVSLSIGNASNVPLTYSPLGNRSGAEWATLEAHRSGKPVFVASGNGFSNSGLTPDHCSTYTSPYTGPAWVTRIGAANPENGNPTWWHCVPVDAIGKTNVGSPSFDDIAAASSASGTSAATPNVAGHWAHLMLAGRRAGTTATRLQTVDYLLHSAAPAAPQPGENEPSVYPLSLADQGYGIVDQAALDAATARLLAGSGAVPRPETEAWFAKDAEIRTALWGPGSMTSGEDTPWGGPQDDAGSGGDAPNTSRGDVVRVEPGVRYDGHTTWVAADDHDWYAFDGTAGDVVRLAGSAAFSCYALVSPSGVNVASGCSVGYAAELAAEPATLTESGTWYIEVNGLFPQAYSFGFGVNGPPPAVFP